MSEQDKPEAAMYISTQGNPVTKSPPRHAINFSTDSDGIVGTLHFGPPMRFEGDAEQSARVFFDYVVHFIGDIRASEANLRRFEELSEKDDYIVSLEEHIQNLEGRG